MSSRRAFIKLSAFSLGAIGAGVSLSSSATAETLAGAASALNLQTTRPTSDIAIWVTSAKQRFSSARPIQWQPARIPLATDPPSISSIRLVATNQFQEILGFGGCFSDASCYVIDKLRQPLRDQLLHELCDPSQMALNVHRTCIGSAD